MSDPGAPCGCEESVRLREERDRLAAGSWAKADIRREALDAVEAAIAERADADMLSEIVPRARDILAAPPATGEDGDRG